MPSEYAGSESMQVFRDMMEIARDNLDPSWKNGQVIVLETWPGQYHYLMIPDFLDHERRESLEDALISHLQEMQDTRVLHCLCTMDGHHPDIPSWNLLHRLMEADPQNLHTELFLQNHGDQLRIRPFSDFLPPKKHKTPENN